MNSFFNKFKKQIEAGKEIAKNSTRYAFKKAEKTLKIESVKVDINSLKKDCEKKMLSLATRVYELYEADELENTELLKHCKEIKMIRWQIEEKWHEIEAIREASIEEEPVAKVRKKKDLSERTIVTESKNEQPPTSEEENKQSKKEDIIDE